MSLNSSRQNKRWCSGLGNRLIAQHQRQQAALRSAGVTKITLSKSGVTESRRMDLSLPSAKAVFPVAYWALELSEKIGILPGQALRLLTLLEEKFIYPACFVVDGKLFWSEDARPVLLSMASAYKRHNADDGAFINSTFVRNFRRKMRKAN